MRISYYKDDNGHLWACIHNSDGTYGHWFLGTQDLASKRERMYSILSKGSIV